MTNLKDYEENISQRYPHYKTYIQCQTKANMVGIGTMITTFAGVYIAMDFMKSRMPFNRSTFFIAPLIFASTAAYMVARTGSNRCQRMWMALEDVHTDLNPISDRKPENRERTNEKSDR